MEDQTCGPFQEMQVNSEMSEQQKNNDVEEHVDQELRALAGDALTKRDLVEPLDQMDISTAPPLNSGDGAVANEIVQYDDNPSHSKSDAGIPRSILKKKRRNFGIPRQLLPRRSKTKAYETLKKIAKGLIPASGIRKPAPKRLKRKRVVKERKNARGRSSKSAPMARRKKLRVPKGRRQTKRRRAAAKTDSGTSMSTLSSSGTSQATCSTCKFDLSSYRDQYFF